MGRLAVIAVATSRAGVPTLGGLFTIGLAFAGRASGASPEDELEAPKTGLAFAGGGSRGMNSTVCLHFLTLAGEDSSFISWPKLVGRSLKSCEVGVCMSTSCVASVPRSIGMPAPFFAQ